MVESKYYQFDCWDLSDGILQSRQVLAPNEKKAIEDFKKFNPGMGFDPPYLK